MLTLNHISFQVKSTEMNLKQRTYQGKSIITAEIMTEFFPKMVDGDVLSGAITIKLDMTQVKSLDVMANKKYQGEIGNVTFSVNKNGIWEHVSCSDFEFAFHKRSGNQFAFEMHTKDPVCDLELTTTLVSLYTTNDEKLKTQFELADFYETPITREIGTSSIKKYYIKDI